MDQIERIIRFTEKHNFYGLSEKEIDAIRSIIPISIDDETNETKE
jgi:hypothetical protein